MTRRHGTLRVAFLTLLALVAGCTAVTLGGLGRPAPTSDPRGVPGGGGTVYGTSTHRVQYDVTCTRCNVDYTDGNGRVTRTGPHDGGWQLSLQVPAQVGSAVLTASPTGDRARVTALRIYVDDFLRAESHPRGEDQTHRVSIAAAVATP